MAAEDPRLLELYISCGESLIQLDMVQAQDLLTAAVYLALGLGDARSISRCQQSLLRINSKHPAVLPDFDRNVKIQAQAAKIQQKYTLQKMEVLRQTLDDLESADRAKRSIVGVSSGTKPETRDRPQAAANAPAPAPAAPPRAAPPPLPPRAVPPQPPPIIEVQPAVAAPVSASAAAGRAATGKTPSGNAPAGPAAAALDPPAPAPTPRPSRPSAPASRPTSSEPAPPLPAFAREPMPPSSHEVNAQDGSTVHFRPSRPAARPVQRPYYLAILSEEMQWESMWPIGPNGVEVGRDQPNQPFGDLATLAPRHARFQVNEQGQIVVEDLGSAGGVFQRIKQKEPLRDGVWLRIGSQLLEFRLLTIAPESDSVEKLWAPAPVTAWAELVVLRADREPTARYPVVPSEVIVGREASRGADLVLYGDRNASSRHARIRRTPDGVEIEDLGSLNGTYIRREGSFTVGPEDILMLGEVMLKILDKGKV